MPVKRLIIDAIGRVGLATAVLAGSFTAAPSRLGLNLVLATILVGGRGVLGCSKFGPSSLLDCPQSYSFDLGGHDLDSLVDLFVHMTTHFG